jgi:signal transduction histidine kinase
LLTKDLQHATRRVRALGTMPGLGASGLTFTQRPRFRLVTELVDAIERLADRFSVFAQAQEDAIRARAVATRTRGLFFATVSHDLKSPLNSILGFTHLVSIEPLTSGQHESLQAIHSRARELLALIETILDAARVEEGQLSLVRDEVPFVDLYAGAVAKAAELSSGYPLQIYKEFEASIPPLLVDRQRVIRAFATLVAYSVRSHKGGKMWIRAERESEHTVRIDVDVPHPDHPPPELEAMLSTQTSARRRDHRGLALGLRLARSVIELHGGAVRVVDRGKKGAMFCVTLPTIPKPLSRPPLSLAALESPDERGSEIPIAVDDVATSAPPPPLSNPPKRGA